VIDNCEGPDLINAFWKAINEVTVLDPTCGSGAFLFAALNILEPLYEACLQRMEAFINEWGDEGKKKHPNYYKFFSETLQRVQQHPNARYFIYKSIIINNLFGVDILEEAVEICKLRLFLKLVAQVEPGQKIEALPDIDFNIRAGNTLVGYATYDEVHKAVTSKLDFDNAMKKIEEKAEDIDRLFALFRQQQTALGGEVAPEDKEELRKRLKSLEEELNRYLATEYGVDLKKKEAYARWLSTHKPFHWFIEFYGIMKQGGFDVIIGNPPYVEYSKVRGEYTIKGYKTEACGNLYPFVVERSMNLSCCGAAVGMIVPVSAFANRSMLALQTYLKGFDRLYISSFHQRPAQLFNGVLQRLSIFLVRNKTAEHLIMTTSVLRWYSNTREILFQNFCFSGVSQQGQEYIFKAGHPIEDSLLRKYLNHQEIQRYLDTRPNKGNFISYRTAGGGYWLTILNTEFETASLSNKIAYFSDSYDARVFMAALNSGVFWWFYYSSFDLFNLKDYMIFSLRLDYPPHGLEQRLISLSEKLQKELLSNAVRYKIRSKTRGDNYTLKYQNFKAKPIIDEIDCVLAQHYGFTDEELDFIINYDIKYRMGRDAGLTDDEKGDGEE
jgi:hypothetical protein